MPSTLLTARSCQHCDKEFDVWTGYANQLYCSITCRKAATRQRRLERDIDAGSSLPMADLPSSARGAIGELTVSIHFQNAGYQVFRNLSPVGPADLVIWKPGSGPVLIDVKSGPYLSSRSPRKDGEQVYLVGVEGGRVFLPEDFPAS